MNGYPGLTKNASQAGYNHNTVSQPKIAAPVMQEIAKPVMSDPPVFDIPKAVVSVPVAAVNPPAAADITSLPPNPMAGGRLSREEALRFIAQD
jgi:hypothetical protein